MCRQWYMQLGVNRQNEPSCEREGEVQWCRGDIRAPFAELVGEEVGQQRRHSPLRSLHKGRARYYA